MWEVDRIPKPVPHGGGLLALQDKESDDDAVGKGGKGAKKGTKKKFGKGNGGKIKQLAKQFRDGTKLCMAYQKNQCKNPNCSLRHACAAVTKSGRVCGGKHPACKCRNKAVARTA